MNDKKSTKKLIEWKWFKDHCDYLEFDDCIYNEDPNNMPPCKQDTCPLWKDLEDAK